MTPLVRYLVARLALFVVVAGAMLVLPIALPVALRVAIALLVSAVVGLVVLRRQRERVASDLAERIVRKRRESDAGA